MNDTSFVIKYDGESEDLKNHMLDAKTLANVLDSISDLIYEANLIVNGPDARIDLKAKAGFVDGSFGIEFVLSQEAIDACKGLLPLLGLGGAGLTTGSLISLVKNIRGNKIADIVIDESSDDVQLLVGDEYISASPDLANLATSSKIRKSLDDLIRAPLSETESSSFKVMNPNNLEEALLEVTKEERSSFKKPPLPNFSHVDVSDTIATVEFIQANKESITSGWKIRHLGEEVPVRLKDETFFENVKRPDAPSIFGLKYKVELTVKTMSRERQAPKKTHVITKVLSAVKH